LAAEQLTAEPLALRLLARAARGSMRDALSLTDQAIAFGNGLVQEAGVRQMLGSVDRSHVLQLIRALTDGDGATVVNQVNALRLQGVSAAATLEDMSLLLQRMAVMQMVPDMAQDGEDPDTQGLAALAQAMPPEETQLLYSLCLHGRTELGLAPDEYAALTMVLLRLLAFKPTTGLAEKKSLQTRPEPLKPTAALAPPLAAAKKADAEAVVLPVLFSPAVSLEAEAETDLQALIAAPVETDNLPEPPPWEEWPDTKDYADAAVSGNPPKPQNPLPALRSLPVRESTQASARLDTPRPMALQQLQATPEGDVWLDVVQGLVMQESITALVRELALQSQLMARDADQWQLRVERETLNHAASRERLQAALQAAGHGDVKLHIEIGPVSDSPARRMAVKAAEKMSAAQELIQNDPLVQAMVRDFGAKIVPGSIQLI
jgi:DNA polymerase-3 subunit gamma/tau